MNSIRAVFFDLDKTLIYPKAPWQAINLRSDKVLTDSLIANGIDVNPRAFPYEFTERINQYYAEREETLRETTTFVTLSHLLEEKGFQNIPAPIIRTALDAKQAVTQSNWQIELDAHETLHVLKLTGYKLALIANAGDNLNVQTLLNTHNLLHFFSFIRTSAAAGYRKPHEHMFKEALRELGVFPQQCAMVGDALGTDIKGANELDIYSIWINRRVNKNTKTLRDIRPKAVIQELTELPKVLLEA